MIRKAPRDALDNNMASQTKIKRNTYQKTNTWMGMRARRVSNRVMKQIDR